METVQTEKVARIYKKPATKKHEALNTVQGSALYYTYNSLYSLYSLYSGLYYVVLYR
jgi:hypothetical protein